MRDICVAAGLTPPEIESIPDYISGDARNDFYESPAYEKLYEYFTTVTAEMPYGTAKARDGDPDYWILNRLEEIEKENSRVADACKAHGNVV